MMNKHNVIILATISCIYFISISTNKVDSKNVKLAEVEEIRMATIQRINRLWRKLSHQEWEKIAESRGGKDVRLLEEYAKICDNFNNVRITPIPDSTTQSLWLYAIIQVETHGINGLYKLFTGYQQSPATDKNPRKWQDFAENVIQDTVYTASVTQATDRIADLIDGDSQNPHLFQQILKVNALPN